SWSEYAYCGGNPVMYGDPLGLHYMDEISGGTISYFPETDRVTPARLNPREGKLVGGAMLAVGGVLTAVGGVAASTTGVGSSVGIPAIGGGAWGVGAGCAMMADAAFGDGATPIPPTL